MHNIIFADTNVFLDAFLKRKSGKDCKQILLLAEKSRIKLYTSSSCLMTIMYFLQKFSMPVHLVRKTVVDLLQFVDLPNMSKDDFLNAMNTDFQDLEDAVLYHGASQIKGIDCFVTSNIRDFEKVSPILPVISPEKFIALMTKPE